MERTFWDLFDKRMLNFSFFCFYGKNRLLVVVSKLRCKKWSFHSPPFVFTRFCVKMRWGDGPRQSKAVFYAEVSESSLF